ncbi:hypothetical protein ABG79_01794 [Caloramator mitchellensis]|uniref:DUF1232 domain-containing protein n=1 Tax=Caloramator mitchellensis TaxID=908809 RepID=A0A0R3JVS6_CALMK|nr:YkvA family protein [Caloramator mitchellensis]KRQ86413.1 hypothetical protein ABG79_01794 [Caloramator mitchellensis]
MKLENLKKRAEDLKNNLYVLYLAYRHPKTPIYAKLWAVLVIAYALSPIDLIPDFLPVLGYLDDLILIPAGITIAIKLVPKEVWNECKEKEVDLKEAKKKGIVAGVIIGLIWAYALYLIIKFLLG